MQTQAPLDPRGLLLLHQRQGLPLQTLQPPASAHHTPPLINPPTTLQYVGAWSVHSHIELLFDSLGEDPPFDATININGTKSFPTVGAQALLLLLGTRAYRSRRTPDTCPLSRL